MRRVATIFLIALAWGAFSRCGVLAQQSPAKEIQAPVKKY